MFHGWKLVGALSVILFFTGGGGLYVFPVFIASLQAEFGWSMTQISSGAALFAIVMGLSSPFVGMLFARFGARGTMLCAAVLSALTFLSYAALRNLWMLYATMLLSGFAIAGTTILPAQTLVTNWFNVYRGRAMGLTMLGIGAGGFLLPPFNEFLIRALGWRRAWLVGCLITLVIVIPLIAAYVRTWPADLGLQPDGVGSGGAGGGAVVPARGLSPKRAVTTVTFWLVVAIYLAQLIGVSALSFHFVPFATQQVGFSSQEAAFFYGSAIGFSIIGRLLFGWLADRWNVTLLIAASLLLLALGPTALELLVVRLGSRANAVLWLYAIPFGIGMGGNAVTLPVLVGRCFGVLHFGKIMGLLMSGFAVGLIVGIPLAGWIFDRTGSYEGALILCAVVLFASSLLALAIRPERYQGEFVGAA